MDRKSADVLVMGMSGGVRDIMTFLIIKWPLRQENRDGVQGLSSFDECQKWRSPLLADLLRCDSGSKDLSRKSDTIFGQGTILEPSTPHIGSGSAERRDSSSRVYIR